MDPYARLCSDIISDAVDAVRRSPPGDRAKIRRHIRDMPKWSIERRRLQQRFRVALEADKARAWLMGADAPVPFARACAMCGLDPDAVLDRLRQAGHLDDTPYDGHDLLKAWKRWLEESNEEPNEPAA